MKYIKLFEAFVNERVKAPKALEELIKGNTTKWEGIKMSKDLADHYLTWLRTSPYGKKYGSDLPLDVVIKASFNWGIERGLDPGLKTELNALRDSIKESVNEANDKVFSEFSNSELAEIEREWEKGSAIKAINMITKKLYGVDISKLDLSNKSQESFDKLYNDYLSNGRKKAATTLIAIYKLIKSTLNESVNEAKAFDADVTKMIKQIKSGMGWIDPEFVEETWENISDTIDFSLVQKELYKRLIDAKLLAWPNPDNEEKKGVHVTRLQDVVKESLDEANDWSKASVSDTLKVAELYAKAIGKADGVKCTVNKKTLEPGSFDLDYPGDKYAGGSYYIEANGDVVNAALSGKPVYGKVDSTVDDIVKVIKKLDK